MHTKGSPQFTMRTCKMGGEQPISCATPCLDTTGKQQHKPVGGEVMMHVNTQEYNVVVSCWAERTVTFHIVDLTCKLPN